MFNYGYYKRATRRVNVLRGFNGCEPETFTRNAAVNDVADQIQSGDLISLNGSGKWVKGAAKGSVPYIALSDYNDTDVNSSGLLPALSCAGKFEIETQAFDPDGTYAEGTPLGAVAADSDPTFVGQLTDVSLSTATDDVDIVGFASRGGLTNLNSGSGPKVEVNAESGNILTFSTNWQPARTA